MEQKLPPDGEPKAQRCKKTLGYTGRTKANRNRVKPGKQFSTNKVCVGVYLYKHAQQKQIKNSVKLCMFKVYYFSVILLFIHIRLLHTNFPLK